MNTFLQEHCKAMLVFFAMAIAFVCYYIYNDKLIPMATVNDTSPSSIAQAQLKAGKFQSIEDANQVSKLIEQRTSKTADVVFNTTTQQEANKKANAMAKQTGADYIMKETIVPETKSAPSNLHIANDNKGIVNNYYAITQEKKNQLLAGVTAIDGSVHFSLGYQREKVQVLVHSKDLKNISGASVMYAIKKF